MEENSVILNLHHCWTLLCGLYQLVVLPVLLVIKILQLFKFFSADVTPPRLTFLENPSYSNANVTISWTIDEEATTTCTLQTPSGLQVVNCNYTLSLTNLHEGVHTLYIQTTDLAGNIARTVRHVWTVGKFSH